MKRPMHTVDESPRETIRVTLADVPSSHGRGLVRLEGTDVLDYFVWHLQSLIRGLLK